MRLKEGFTPIELLVVISIVGMLSSIILIKVKTITVPVFLTYFVHLN